MRSLKRGALIALALVAASAVFASSAAATPSRTSRCTGCHGGPNVPVTATVASTNGTSVTYNASAPGADVIAIFDGTVKIAQISGASGQFTVTAGKTYTLYSVAGPGESDGLGTTTVSPVAAPVDVTAPVTSSNAQATYVSLAAITLTATDAGSGVATTYYRLDGGAQVAGTAVAVSALGSHTLQFWSVDKAGNVEAAKTVTFTVTAPVPVDATAPTTVSDATSSYVSSALIKLTATDAGSGVATTYYRLDGGAQVAGTSVSVSTVGSHTLQFWSVDKAGNIETAKTVTFTVTAPVPVDATAPVTVSDAKPSYVSSALIKLTATDAGSGVATTYYRLDGGAQVAGTAVSVSTVGSHTLQFWSVDKAGNVEAAKTVTFTVTAPAPVDTTAPVTVSDAKPSYVSSALIKLTATDAGSGVATTYYRLDGGTQVAGTSVTVSTVGTHTVDFWSVDKAGNAEAPSSATFVITAPDPGTEPTATASVLTLRTASRARVGRILPLGGSLTPAQGGEVVGLYVMKPGSSTWTYVSSRTTRTYEQLFSRYVMAGDDDDDDEDEDEDDAPRVYPSTASVTFMYRPATRGTYRFQTRFAGDADSAATVSRTVTVEVR